MIDIENSRPLDVHRWSDHPEVSDLSNALLEEIFPKGFPNRHTHKIREKALRVLLLNLYCCWQDDPDMSIGISLGKASYNKAFRYNKLGLTCSPIKLCFDALLQHGYIEVVMGDRRIQRVTRMRATDLLRDRYEAAEWNLNHSLDKIVDEVIIVNIPKGKKLLDGHRYSKRIVERDVDYRETARSRAMRSDLERYNAFISQFDFRTQLDDGEFFVDDNLPVYKVRLHRVFSNTSLTEGGRFYGGFQNMDKRQRPLITIDGATTVEIDFSSFHPTLAYAKVGVDFYRTTGREDIYMPDDFGYDRETYAQYRTVVKIMFNTLINARSESGAASSMFLEVTENYEYQSHGQYEQLKYLCPPDITPGLIKRLIAWIKSQHPEIADLFCQDLGRHFMFIDSQIASRILMKMMNADKPVLPVHDSYICKEEDQPLLEQFIKESFTEEMHALGWAPITYKTKVTGLNL